MDAYHPYAAHPSPYRSTQCCGMCLGYRCTVWRSSCGLLRRLYATGSGSVPSSPRKAKAYGAHNGLGIRGDVALSQAQAAQTVALESPRLGDGPVTRLGMGASDKAMMQPRVDHLATWDVSMSCRDKGVAYASVIPQINAYRAQQRPIPPRVIIAANAIGAGASNTRRASWPGRKPWSISQ